MRFYTLLASRTLGATFNSDRDELLQANVPLRRFKNDFNAAYRSYHVPMSEPLREGDYDPAPEHAAVCLQHYFHTPTLDASTEHSPLLDLPTELRELIFTLALRIAPTALVHGDMPTTCGLRSLARDVSAPIDLLERADEDFQYVDERQSRLYDLANISRLLSLLQVNKQCHAEALPLFYQVNTIFLRDWKGMRVYVGRLPLSHMACLASLAIAVPIGGGTAGVRGLHPLSLLRYKCPRMRKMILRLDTAGGRASLLPHDTALENIPALRLLAQFRGVKELMIVREEASDLRNDWLRAAVTLPHQEDEKSEQRTPEELESWQ